MNRPIKPLASWKGQDRFFGEVKSTLTAIFLSGGCSDAPVELLKIAGVNLETPAPIQSALDVMDEILDEMEALL